LIAVKSVRKEAKRKVFWTRVRFPPGPPKAYWLERVNSRIVPDIQYASDGPDLDIDRARSNRVDSTVGDDRKSSKTHKRQRRRLFSSRLRLDGAGKAL